jgi:cbb3-type cytochrome oxidase maturation protein
MIDFFFIPIAIGLGLVGLASFMWTLKNGQYDDLQGAAERILFEGQDGPLIDGRYTDAMGTGRVRRARHTDQSIPLNAKLGNFEEAPNNILLAFFQKHLNCRCQTLIEGESARRPETFGCSQPIIWMSASPASPVVQATGGIGVRDAETR